MLQRLDNLGPSVPLIDTHPDAIMHMNFHQMATRYNVGGFDVTSMHDFSGNGHNLTLESGVSQATLWGQKKAAYIHGTAGYMETSDASFQFASGAFAFILMFRFHTSPSSHQRILGTKDTTFGNDAGWCLHWDSGGGRLRFAVADGTNYAFVESDANRVSDTEWHIILCRRAANGISMKIDNDGNSSASIAGFGSLSNARNLVLGAREGSPYTEYSNIWVSELQILSSSLNTSYFQYYRNSCYTLRLVNNNFDGNW